MNKIKIISITIFLIILALPLPFYGSDNYKVYDVTNLNSPISHYLETYRLNYNTLLLQYHLNILGYNPGPLDGIFGRRTKSAVKRFQRAYGLTPDGIVGPKTRTCLHSRIYFNTAYTNTKIISLPAEYYTSPKYVYDYKGRLVPYIAENRSYYGEISKLTNRPKVVYVRGYYRKDGTYVRSHYRSRPKR